MEPHVFRHQHTRRPEPPVLDLVTGCRFRRDRHYEHRGPLDRPARQCLTAPFTGSLAFMTLLCVRHLSWRTRIQQRQASPEAIRRALVRVQCSILGDRSTGRRYVLPSAIGDLVRKLYAVMGLKRTTEAFELTAPSGRNRS